MHQKLNIGTCSWKYDSWQGLVYPEEKPFDYLEEYSRHYNCVEVDQWFWSLFTGNTVVLPKPETVRQYAAAAPDDFTFCVKVPNSISLTHHYKKKKADPLVDNPYFFSPSLMLEFLDRLEPLHKHLGPLIFQFEYLNKLKMPGGVSQFSDLLGNFTEQLPKEFTYCVETRNPNYLGREYFKFLRQIKVHHVFLHGYYMPSIFDVYRKYREHVWDMAVIRLHGPDRHGIEKITGKKWHEIVAPKDDDIATLIKMLEFMHAQGLEIFTFVNNHFEGSAPRTIQKIIDGLT